MHKSFNESTIEHHAIARFRELGYAYDFGPDIGPDDNQIDCEAYETDL